MFSTRLETESAEEEQDGWIDRSDWRGTIEREREGRRKRRNELMGGRAEDDEKKEVNLGIGSEGPRCDAL